MAHTLRQCFRKLGFRNREISKIRKVVSEIAARCSLAIYLSRFSKKWDRKRNLLSHDSISDVAVPQAPLLSDRMDLKVATDIKQNMSGGLFKIQIPHVTPGSRLIHENSKDLDEPSDNLDILSTRKALTELLPHAPLEVITGLTASFGRRHQKITQARDKLLQYLKQRKILKSLKGKRLTPVLE